MDIVLKSIMGKDKKAVVGKINVQVGETVSEGTVIMQLETKKGNSPVKSEYSGIMNEICVSEGSEVSIGDVIAKLDADQKTEKPKLDYFGSLIKGKKEEVTTDILVIGGGPGGYVAAIYAAKHNKNVILVEKAKLGGTCLNEGCIPTKALVKSAHVYKDIINSQMFGVSASDVKKDMSKIIDRKNEIKDKLIGGIEYLMLKNNIRVINGEAQFLNDSKVVVKAGRDEYTVNAENIIIATGSKISNINVPGADYEFVMDSRSALENRSDIESVTIIGAGVIGMEFAFIYSNLGMKVNLVEYCDRVLTMVDSEVSEEITAIAKDSKIGVYTDSKLTKIGKDQNNKAVVFFENNGEEKYIVSDKVLMATGRIANFDNLGIENTSIQLNDRQNAIEVDTNMRTNVKNVYAIGDVNGRMQLAHVASHEGIVAVDNILGKNVEMKYSAVPNVIFTSPEIASVGITEDFAKAQNINIKVSKFPFSANGKALTMNEEEGFVKLIKNLDTNKLEGASVIGPDAASLIATLTVMINCEIDEDEIRHTIFAHPTTSEAIHESILGFSEGALHYHE